MAIFKNMSGNIPGGNFPGGGDLPWESLIAGNFPGGSFPGIEYRNIYFIFSNHFIN